MQKECFDEITRDEWEEIGNMNGWFDDHTR